MTAVTPRVASAEITLRGLVTARWVLLGLLTIAGALDALTPAVLDPLLSWFPTQARPGSFLVVITAWAAVNVATARLVIDRGRATETLAGVHLLLDALGLTGLLALSGGATNPFTTLYFVPITLATQVSPRWTWTLAGFSLACFAALFVTIPLPPMPPGHEAHFKGHLYGMWVAFGVSGSLITYFVHRIALSLARQRNELARLRDEAIQDRHLAGLGSLAAGAAHELGTPLGTINLLVSELPHMTAAERDEAVADIKREIARCKTIVQRMASPEIRVSTLRTLEPWPLARVVEGLEPPPDIDLRIDIDPAAEVARTTQPHENLAQIVRELVSNAIQACKKRSDSRGVLVRVRVAGDRGILEIEDDGVGMDAATAEAAFDPFFSTRPEGEGMGLGLYLCRAQLRQLGGSIELVSSPGQGSRFVVDLPLNNQERKR